MTTVNTTPRPPGPDAGLRLGMAEQELYAGILASVGSLVSASAAVPRDAVDVFRMAYALLDGLPAHVVTGVAAEAIRARYGHSAESDCSRTPPPDPGNPSAATHLRVPP